LTVTTYSVILSSLALSTNALPFLASIPLLVPDQAHIGTAFGIWKGELSRYCASLLLTPVPSLQ
jgi:hypothetical protein